MCSRVPAHPPKPTPTQEMLDKPLACASSGSMASLPATARRQLRRSLAVKRPPPSCLGACFVASRPHAHDPRRPARRGLATSPGGGPPGAETAYGVADSLMESWAVQTMQTMVEGMHGVTGLPWWATIAATTLGVRAAMLPLVRYQAWAVSRFARSVPQLGQLNGLLSKRLDQIKPGQLRETTDACRTYMSGARAVLAMHRVSLLAMVSPPLIQIPIFVTFALANRRMINEGVEGLDEGGILWFEDLTEVKSHRRGVACVEALGGWSRAPVSSLCCRRTRLWCCRCCASSPRT
jgi:hypothetical protein